MTDSRLLYILIALFSIGSWIDINGVWVELPVLVNELPEGWYLPSYMTIVIQLANIGPVVYSVVRAHVGPSALHNVLDPVVSFLVLLIGAISCACLIKLWDVTAWIGGAEHSVAFLSLVFVIGLTDCTSSVTFLSYIGRFPSRYVTAYYVGAGASGLIPSVLALIQGASRVTCWSAQNISNLTNVTSESSQTSVSHLFSVEVFFGFLTAFLLLAALAFALVHAQYGRHTHSQMDSDVRSSSDVELSQPRNQAEGVASSPLIVERKFRCKAQYVVLLLTVSCSFLLNGFMPPLQTFSVLPYGQEAYYVTVCLYSLTQPVASFAAFLLPLRKVRYCILLNVVAWLSAIFLVTFALLSPVPLRGTLTGPILVISAWVLLTAAVAYSRPNLAMLVNRKMSRSGLFWCGVLTQCGACAGAMLAFLLVNVLQIFKASDSC